MNVELLENHLVAVADAYKMAQNRKDDLLLAAQYQSLKEEQFSYLLLDILLIPRPLSLDEGQNILSFVQKTMKDFELHQDKNIFEVLGELSENLPFLWDEDYGDEAKIWVENHLNYLGFAAYYILKTAQTPPLNADNAPSLDLFRAQYAQLDLEQAARRYLQAGDSSGLKNVI